MKTLIILSGVSNCGKTTTLKLLVQDLFKEMKVTQADVNPLSNVDYLTIHSYNYFEDKSSTKDWLVVFTSPIHAKVIGIHTAGDMASQVSQSLSLLSSCDVVICATKALMKSDQGSISTMKKGIYQHISNINIIPLYKLLHKGNHHEDDILMKDIIKSLVDKAL